jgi:hypothetical protein
MSRSSRSRRTATIALATAGVAGSLIAGVAAAGAAVAAPAHPDGFSVVASCTSVSGSINYSPGLRKGLLRNTSAVLNATTAGCSNAFTGAESGTGTLTAILHGKASPASQNLAGTFTLNWPASSGFNPSNGNLSVRSMGNHQYAVSGTVTSGFDTGSVLSLGYLTTSQKGNGTKAHPIVRQNFVNTTPLALSRNLG